MRFFKYRDKYTKESLLEAVANSNSLNDIMRFLDIPVSGGNSKTIRDKLQHFDIDISHFRFINPLKNFSFSDHPLAFLDDEIFNGARKNRFVNGTRLKTALMRSGVEYKCLECGINEWRGEKLVLDVDHIDGSPFNNSFDNLRFLCPNCHRQTPTYSNKRRVAKEKYKYTCVGCNEEIEVIYKKSSRSSRCRKCTAEDIARKHNRVSKHRVSKDILISIIEEKGYLQTGKYFGVSDNAIRKWVRSYGLDPKSIKKKKRLDK